MNLIDDVKLERGTFDFFEVGTRKTNAFGGNLEDLNFGNGDSEEEDEAEMKVINLKSKNDDLDSGIEVSLDSIQELFVTSKHKKNEEKEREKRISEIRYNMKEY